MANDFIQLRIDEQLKAEATDIYGIRPLYHRQTLNRADSVTVKPEG